MIMNGDASTPSVAPTKDVNADISLEPSGAPDRIILPPHPTPMMKKQ